MPFRDLFIRALGVLVLTSVSPQGAAQPIEGFVDMEQRWSQRFVRPNKGPVRALLVDRRGHLISGGAIPALWGTPHTGRHGARWDGRRWIPLGSGVNGHIHALAMHPSGDIYAAGEFTEAGEVPANRVARWDGSAWHAVGAGFNGTVRTLLISEAGIVYAGGDFTASGGLQTRHVAFFDGQFWDELLQGLNGVVHTLARSPSGELYAGGSFNGSAGSAVPLPRLARVGFNQWIDVDFSSQLSGSAVHAIAFDAEGHLLVGGGITADGGNIRGLARRAGAGWTAVGGGIPSASAAVFALAFDAEGGLFVGGNMTGAVDGFNVGMVARFHDGQWSDLDRGVRTLTQPVHALAPAGFGDAMYVGGEFIRIGNVPAGANGGAPFSSVARWQDGRWQGLGQGISGNTVTDLNAEVRAITVSPSTEVLASGSFRSLGGANSPNIARWWGSFWSPVNQLQGMAGSFATGNAVVVDLEGRTVVAGTFSEYDGEPRANIARQRQDGVWEALGDGLGGNVHALAVTPFGQLHAAGSFTSSGATSLARVARFDGVGWQPMGQGLNATVQALAVSADEQIYAGGSFSNSGGSAVNRVVRWTGTAWESVGSGMNNAVHTLFFAPDGSLYAGGTFTQAGGQAVNRIARFDGSNWQPLGEGLNGSVFALAMDPEGRLYAGGQFGASGATSASHIAWWDGETWQPLGAGLTHTNTGVLVNALAADDRFLYVGGRFTHADGRPSAGFARFTFGDIDCQEFVCPANTDLEATGLEVVQAVQTDDNEGRLVAGKRTFVRLHGRANFNAPQTTYARLRIHGPGTDTYVDPVAEDVEVSLDETANREFAQSSVVFELPSQFLSGTLQLTGEFNPVTTWRDHDPPETDYDNNNVSVEVSFEVVSPLRLRMFPVQYAWATEDVTSIELTPMSEVLQAVDWMERTFPTPPIDLEIQTLAWSSEPGPLPSCSLLNLRLLNQRVLDFHEGGSNIDSLRRVYYAIIIDTHTFMRGCSPVPLGSRVASGPTGPTVEGRDWEEDFDGTWGWDTDGSYGDWYTGHEVGHAMGETHALYCGAEGGGEPPYPYFGAAIGPVTGRWVGFDRGTLSVLRSRDWTDLMAYCKWQWISHFTHDRLMDTLQSDAKVQQKRLDQRLAKQSLGPRFLVTGTVDPKTLETSLRPAQLLPEAIDIFGRDEQGMFDIVLRDSADNELARYPFHPYQFEGALDADAALREVDEWMIAELVPWVAGTARIDIEFEGRGVLASLDPGPAEPVIAFDAPAPGSTLDGDTVSVSWSASDADGDPLSFVLQYSSDGGQNWRVLVAESEDQDIDLDIVELEPSTDARFRVRVSDGVNTATVESGALIVPPREVAISVLEPLPNARFSSEQSVPLQAFARAMGGARLDGSSLLWSSDIDGVLGEGATLITTGLSAGPHRISVNASGGGEAEVPIYVVAHAGQLPLPLDRLLASPRSVVRLGEEPRTLQLRNQNGGNPAIPWQAQTSTPWLTLSRTQGTTPDEILLSADLGDLLPGTYPAQIQLRSAWLPGVVETLDLLLLVGEGEPGTPGEAVFADGFEAL